MRLLRRIPSMSRAACVLVGLACLAPGAGAWAQTQPRPAAEVLPAAPPTEPRIELRVVEDDGVRIEQLHWRGQAQSVVVQSKVGGARPYEIVLGRYGRDPSLHPGALGQSRWSLVRF
jgi:hypothetical protein